MRAAIKDEEVWLGEYWEHCYSDAKIIGLGYKIVDFSMMIGIPTSKLIASDFGVFGGVYTLMTQKMLQRLTAENDCNIKMLEGRYISKLIRMKYSLDDELALTRQKEDKFIEYNDYNNYCHRCKNEGKLAVNLRTIQDRNKGIVLVEYRLSE